jgi:RNA polymerase sigma factor (sigma-70 family)
MSCAVYTAREKETALDVANMESACDFSSDCDFTDVMNDVIDIRRAVASLSSDERELISLIFTHGMSYSEVSLVMGMPVGTVKSKMSSIKTKLRKILGEVYYG